VATITMTACLQSAFARIRSRSLAPLEVAANERFRRTHANRRERLPAFAMQKVVGSSPIMRFQSPRKIGRFVFSSNGGSRPRLTWSSLVGFAWPVSERTVQIFVQHQLPCLSRQPAAGVVPDGRGRLPVHSLHSACVTGARRRNLSSGP
jgi:hypothetical protein